MKRPEPTDASELFSGCEPTLLFDQPVGHVEFPDRGHSLTIDSGWPAVAAESLSWLARQGL